MKFHNKGKKFKYIKNLPAKTFKEDEDELKEKNALEYRTMQSGGQRNKM